MRAPLVRTLSLVCWACLIAAIALPGAPAAQQAFKPFRLKDLEGQTRTLADFPGKATLVVFFYPTCAYCNASFGAIQRLYDTYHDRGLSMVWINVVPREERLIVPWQAKHGYTVPVLVGANLRALQRDYGVQMTPTHYLLDERGRVLARHQGYTRGDESVLEVEIRKALDVSE
jgi:glutathione peroxidase-family protein